MELINGIVTAFAVALAPVFATIAARLVTRWLRMEEDHALRESLERGLQAGAGLAYVAVTRGDAMDTAIQAGASYVAIRMPDTMGTLGVRRPDLAGMIEARLGALLAVDPTVQGPKS